MAKIAMIYLLEPGKAKLPEHFGMKLAVEGIISGYDSLMRDCALSKLAYTDFTAYCLHFFKKPFEVQLLWVIRDLDHQAGSNLTNSCRRQAATVLEVNEESAFYDPDYLLRALWLPRGVQKQEFASMVASFSGGSDIDPMSLPRLNSKDCWIMNHPDGFILGSKNEDDFLRSQVLYGLLLAYHRHFGLAINRISSNTATGADQLLALKEEIYRFKAHYYFRNPMKPGRRRDHAEYDHLAKALNFEALEQQLQGKLDDIANLIRVRQSRARFDPDTAIIEALKTDDRPARLSEQHNPAPRTLPTPGVVAVLIAGLLLSVLVVLVVEYGVSGAGQLLLQLFQ